MKQVHTIQLQILKKLLFSTSLRYSDLKPEDSIENNQLDFHLDQLIKEKIIEKGDIGYRLTNFGKEFANRMDTEKVVIQKQAKIGVVLCPIKVNKNIREYLIYTRLKQPFYGCQGFMSGKVAYGENIIDTAVRELKEETNLEGKPELIAVKHYRVKNLSSQELLEDKILFFCRIINPKGELKSSNEGIYEWVKESDLKKYVTNHFESFKVFRSDVNLIKIFKGQIIFEEVEHKSHKF